MFLHPSLDNIVILNSLMRILGEVHTGSYMRDWTKPDPQTPNHMPSPDAKQIRVNLLQNSSYYNKVIEKSPGKLTKSGV